MRLLPAEHCNAFTVVPARGSNRSQRDASPEGCHPPLSHQLRLWLAQGSTVCLEESQGGCQSVQQLVVLLLSSIVLSEELGIFLSLSS